MVNIEYTPDFLIPNNYHYEKELLSPLSPESFLYLLGGGSIHTDSPLAFRFSSMDCGPLEVLPVWLRANHPFWPVS